MGIGRLMAKAVNYAVYAGKRTGAKAVKQIANVGAKTAAPAPSILSKVETNTAGRILRMQDAKIAFTPVKPYATKVTKESVPTLQKIEEITGVARGAVKDATGYFDKKAAADALAAFKHEPVKLAGGKLSVTSTPTQQYLDNMHNIGKIEALKTYEQGGRPTREILEARADARKAFTSGDKPISRFSLKYDKFFTKNYDKCMLDKKCLKIYQEPLGFKTVNSKTMQEIKDLNKFCKKA